MKIKDYDYLGLEFEEFSVMIPNNVIEKFEIEKVDQLIEKKYNPEDIYNVYIVINRKLLEKLWNEEHDNLFKGIPFKILAGNPRFKYKSFTNCITDNHIYEIETYKDEKILQKYSPVWSYTEFKNEYQKNGITDEKIIIRIKEI